MESCAVEEVLVLKATVGLLSPLSVGILLPECVKKLLELMFMGALFLDGSKDLINGASLLKGLSEAVVTWGALGSKTGA